MNALDDEAFSSLTSPAQRAELEQSLELLDGAGEELRPELVLSGALAPAFFGSALSGFGVDLLLDALLSFAPPPCRIATYSIYLLSSTWLLYIWSGASMPMRPRVVARTDLAAATSWVVVFINFLARGGGI